MPQKINKNKLQRFLSKNKNRPMPKTAKDSFPKETMQKWDAWVESDGRKEIKNKLSTNIPEKQKTMPTNITKTKNEQLQKKWSQSLVNEIKKLLLEKEKQNLDSSEDQELDDKALGFDKDDEMSLAKLKINKDNDPDEDKEKSEDFKEEEDDLSSLFDDEKDSQLTGPNNKEEIARSFKEGIDRYINGINNVLDKLNSTREGSLNMFLLEMEQKYPQLDFSDYRSISNKILAAATALGDLKEQLNGLVFYIYRTLIRPAEKK